MPMSRLDSFEHGFVFVFRHRVDQIDARLVDGENIRRCEDTDVRCHDRLCIHAFAVAGNRHVAHDVNIRDILTKEIDRCLGRFGDALHQFLFRDRPHIIRAFLLMDPLLADASIRAADADVLIGTAEAAIA